MIRTGFFIILISILCTWSSCEELGPNINLGSNTGEPVTGEQAQRVLVEEFTGVQCVNCPSASEHLQTLGSQYGDRLVVVAIHTGHFSDPYEESNHDFRTAAGTQIEGFLGNPQGYPVASINRTVFSGESEAIIGRNKWAGYIANEMEKEPLVEIALEKNFNAASRKLDVTAKLSFVKNVDDDLKVTVVVTESDIVDVQLTPEGKDYDYKHKHVFRAVMGQTLGDAYTGTTSQGSTGSMDFSMTLPTGWNEGNCELVAFVHSATQREVLQAYTIGLVD